MFVDSVSDKEQKSTKGLDKRLHYIFWDPKMKRER